VPSDTAVAVSDSRGAFTFVGVPPGQYTLTILKRPVMTRQSQTVSVSAPSGGGSMAVFGGYAGPVPMEPTLWAAQPLTVGTSDLDNVRISARTGGRVSGRFEFVGGTPPAPDRIKLIGVQMRGVPGTTAALVPVPIPGTVNEDGVTFRTTELVPGKYVATVQSLPAGWVLKSAVTSGRDAADVPVDVDSGGITDMVVTFVNQTTKLSGTVTVEPSMKDPPTVIVFPADQTLWSKPGLPSRRQRTAGVAGAAATYTVNNLPAGEYLVAATTSVVDFTDPKVLEFLSRSAAHVSIAPGETKSQDVRAVDVPVR
jgi:uncharacterized protein (DUF2141 family)